jgi:hypothetical protein
MPTPLTTEDRTLSRVVSIGRPPSVDTSTVTGNVPGARVSTRIRSVWLCGGNTMMRSAPLRKRQVVAGETDAHDDGLVGVVAEGDRDLGRVEVRVTVDWSGTRCSTGNRGPTYRSPEQRAGLRPTGGLAHDAASDDLKARSPDTTRVGQAGNRLATAARSMTALK